MTSQSQRGALVLKLSVFLFLFSLLIASWVSWRLWQNQRGPWFTQPLPTTTTPTPLDVLSPTVTIDNTLTNKKTTLEENLITPMRQYYATREEQLSAIIIAPHNHETWRMEVTLELQTNNGPITRRFLYDERPWDPSLLDITSPPEEAEDEPGA